MGNIVIHTEKPSVGMLVAAALDKICLSNGKTIPFSGIKTSENQIKAEQKKTGYLKITYRGKPCFVTWGFGHLVELKQAADYNPAWKNWSALPLPFYPDDHMLRVKAGKNDDYNKKVEAQFNLVAKLLRGAELIINATDFDREGEVIFSYIYELAGATAPVMRAKFASQTLQGIRDGFANAVPGKEMKLLEAAGRARGMADLGVGATMTAAMTLQHPASGILSIGRVQTPTLAMFVEKELAIRNFVPTPYWTLEAVFTTPDGEKYKAARKERIDSRSEADELLGAVEGRAGVITSVKKKETVKQPPHLYSLSALQMDANSKFGFSLKRTLDAAQRLYDEGYTTYPRTNSQYLTEDMEPTVNKLLDALEAGEDYYSLIVGRPRKFNRSYYFDNSKVESHYAIIPTENIPDDLSGDDAKIYDLVCRSVIRMLYGSATLLQTTVTTVTNGVSFTSNGTVIKEPGWMAVGDAAKTELLPMLSEGMACSGDYDVKEKKTEPPKRYTDKSILSAMITAGKQVEEEELKGILENGQNKGIGTEATRAAILETLLERAYIERNGKAFEATDKGIALIQNLPVKALKSPSMTAQWELRLSKIEKGEEDPDVFKRDIIIELGGWVKQVQNSNTDRFGNTPGEFKANCPVCGEPMRKFTWGYGCTGYKTDKCNFSISGTMFGKKLPEREVIRLITTGSTNKISGFISKKKDEKTGDPIKYAARLYYDKETKSIKLSFK